MSIESSRLSIIVPAHNEELRIESTLRDLRRALPDAEIIVVVNNSSDRTIDIVRSIVAIDLKTRLIDVPAHTGKGGAVRIGFGLATKGYVAFVDADGATSGVEIARLLTFLENSDCVVASRWLSGAKIEVHQSALRRVLGRGFNACVRLLFGMRLTDTQCGAKLFRRSILESILDELETADFAFDVDVLYAVHRRGLTIREIPTVWRERAGSKVNLGVAVPRMFLSLVRLRLRHSFLRIVLPLFDRSFHLSPIRSRRALRYLVIAPNDGQSTLSMSLEREVRSLCRAIESPRCEIVWFAVEGRRWLLPAPRSVRAMYAYLRTFRDNFDCVIEVVPDGKPFWTPAYCLKPKVVIKSAEAKLSPLYSSTLVMEGHPTKRDLEETMVLAVTRANAHIYIDKNGRLVLTERTSGRAIREMFIANAENLQLRHAPTTERYS